VALLINNAGYGALGPLGELPMNELRLQFETNVFGLVALVQALLPDMVRQRSGRIVNISSVSGVLPTPFAGAYCATKAAVNALSDSLRMELQPFGIEVITVQPGGVASQFSATAAKRSNLKEASLYAAVTDAIAARVGASQARATPAEVFARKMADAVLAPNPQAVVRIGHHSLLLPFLKRWLPTRALDRVLSRRFRLNRLS
jgi:short-subunit dehydrogenase